MALREVIGQAVVEFIGDKTKFETDMSGVQKSMETLGGKMESVGKTLTTNVSLPLAAMGTAALKMSTDFNSAMANVASLIPNSTTRVNELKGSIQDLAIETGRSTKDLANGLYEVISAFGDSEDSMNLLTVASKAAVAGLAGTKDTIGLLAGVIKGYNLDMSEAQHVSDLAFQAIKDGQTTFSELASEIGRVIPLAASLGVKQEELFGAYSALTGVTGSTNEVTTQLRATYQAILKPSADMAVALGQIAAGMAKSGQLTGENADQILQLNSVIEQGTARMAQLQAMGKQNSTEYQTLSKEVEKAKTALGNLAAGMGTAIVQHQGFNETLLQIAASANGDTNQLGKMFGSVEALNAVLALSGAQQESWIDKTNRMGDVTGATTQAFNEQANGINKTGFTMQMFQQQVAVTMQRLGDGLAPALGAVLTAAQPVVSIITSLAGIFANLPAPVQTVIVGLAALVAAIGPVIFITGSLINSVNSTIMAFNALKTLAPLVGQVVGALASGPAAPFVLVGTIVAALALIIYRNWDGIKARTIEVWSAISGFFTTIIEAIRMSVSAAVNGWMQIWTSHWNSVRVIFSTALNAIVSMVGLILGQVTARVTSFKNTLYNLWSAHWSAMKAVVSTVFGPAVGIIENISSRMTGAFRNAARNIRGAWDGIAGFFSGLWNSVIGAFERALSRIQGIASAIASAAQRARDAASAVINFGSKEQIAGAIRSRSVPKMAHGGRIVKPGLALVGERGPELLNLPRGSEVIPLNRSQGSSGVQFVQNISAQATPSDIQHYTERALRRIASEWGIR